MVTDKVRAKLLHIAKARKSLALPTLSLGKTSNDRDGVLVTYSIFFFVSLRTLSTVSRIKDDSKTLYTMIERSSKHFITSVHASLAALI